MKDFIGYASNTVSAVSIALLIWIGSTVTNTATSVTELKAVQKNILTNQKTLTDVIQKKADREAVAQIHIERQRLWDHIMEMERRLSKDP